MDQSCFFKGYCLGNLLRGRHGGAALARAAGKSGGAAYDKESFLSGLAAGMAAKGSIRFQNITVTAGRELYAQYFTLTPCVTRYSDRPVDEYGLMVVTDDGAEIERAAVCVIQSGTVWQRTASVRGTVTTATAVPYVAYKGEIVASGLTSGEINTFPMARDADGIFSIGGTYRLISADLQDADGGYLTALNRGISQSKARLFTDLEEMKAWMLA